MTVHLLELQPLKALLSITMITDEGIWIMSRMVINRRKFNIIREKRAHVPLYTQDMQRLSWDQNQTSTVKGHKLVSELNGY
jgi:hypothetical protein